MHYAMLKRIKSQQNKVPDHVSRTNEFPHFSKMKSNNSPAEIICPNVMNDLVKMSILEMKSMIADE